MMVVVYVAMIAAVAAISTFAVRKYRDWTQEPVVVSSEKAADVPTTAAAGPQRVSDIVKRLEQSSSSVPPPPPPHSSVQKTATQPFKQTSPSTDKHSPSNSVPLQTKPPAAQHPVAVAAPPILAKPPAASSSANSVPAQPAIVSAPHAKVVAPTLIVPSQSVDSPAPDRVERAQPKPQVVLRDEIKAAIGDGITVAVRSRSRVAGSLDAAKLEEARRLNALRLETGSISDAELKSALDKIGISLEQLTSMFQEQQPQQKQQQQQQQQQQAASSSSDAVEKKPASTELGAPPKKQGRAAAMARLEEAKKRYTTWDPRSLQKQKNASGPGASSAPVRTQEMDFGGKKPAIVPPPANLTLNFVDQAAVCKILNESQESGSIINWIVFGFVSRGDLSIDIQGSGSGGVPEVKQILRDDQSCFVLVRFNVKPVPKVAFLTWVGPTIRAMEKSKSIAYSAIFLAFIKSMGYQIAGELVCYGREDFDQLKIRAKLNIRDEEPPVVVKRPTPPQPTAPKIPEGDSTAGNSSTVEIAITAAPVEAPVDAPAADPAAAPEQAVPEATPKPARSGVPRKSRMTIRFTNEDQFQQIATELKNPEHPTNWVVFGFESNEFTDIVGSGAGGFSEALPLLQEDRYNFVLFALKTAESDVKITFISWLGGRVQGFSVAKSSGHRTILLSHLKKHISIAAEFQLFSKDDFDEKFIRQKVLGVLEGSAVECASENAADDSEQSTPRLAAGKFKKPKRAASGSTRKRTVKAAAPDQNEHKDNNNNNEEEEEKQQQQQQQPPAVKKSELAAEKDFDPSTKYLTVGPGRPTGGARALGGVDLKDLMRHRAKVLAAKREEKESANSNQES